MEVVASLSQGRTAAAQCGLFTHRSVPVIFEPPCTWSHIYRGRFRELSNMKLDCRPLKPDMKFVLRALNCYVELVHVYEVDFEDENCTTETVYKYSLGC